MKRLAFECLWATMEIPEDGSPMNGNLTKDGKLIFLKCNGKVFDIFQAFEPTDETLTVWFGYDANGDDVEGVVMVEYCEIATDEEVAAWIAANKARIA
jgi:hypothetical protein